MSYLLAITMKVLTVLMMVIQIAVSEGTTCDSIGVCGCKLSNGKGTIDLSPLMKLGSAPLFTGIVGTSKTTYDFDPCREFSCGTSGLQTRVCGSGEVLGKDITYHYDETSNLVSFIYSQTSGSVELVQTHVEMHCKSNEKGVGILNQFEQKPLHTPNFYTSLGSTYACTIKTNHSNKLSTGSVLCILLLVFVILYIVVGILVNKYVRKLESDLFPNITFWRDFPLLVKAGVSFTIEKLPFKQKSEYEEI